MSFDRRRKLWQAESTSVPGDMTDEAAQLYSMLYAPSNKFDSGKKTNRGYSGCLLSSRKIRGTCYQCIVGVVVTWIVANHYFDPPRVRFPDNACFYLPNYKLFKLLLNCQELALFNTNTKLVEMDRYPQGGSESKEYENNIRRCAILPGQNRPSVMLR